MLTALKAAAAKFASHTQAKVLKKDFLKLALKAKLMFDEKRITQVFAAPVCERARSHRAAPHPELVGGGGRASEQQPRANRGLLRARCACVPARLCAPARPAMMQPALRPWTWSRWWPL